MLAETQIVRNPHVRKPALPNLSMKPQLFSGSKGKAALDQLHGFFNRHLLWNGHEDVKMIGHHHKFVDYDSF
jgi:hypothetical protein